MMYWVVWARLGPELRDGTVGFDTFFPAWDEALFATAHSLPWEGAFSLTGRIRDTHIGSVMTGRVWEVDFSRKRRLGGDERDSGDLVSLFWLHLFVIRTYLATTTSDTFYIRT